MSILDLIFQMWYRPVGTLCHCQSDVRSALLTNDPDLHMCSKKRGTSVKIEYRLPTFSEYKKLRGSVGWWETDKSATEKALKNSLFSVVAVEHDTVIGFGRVIGDGELYFYIRDLIVHPEFQNKGFGKSLMKELLSYITASAKSGAFVGLMAAKGLEKYYEPFGFKARDKDAPGMYQIIK